VSWASGLLADEQAQHQQLSVRASNNAHEGQPVQPTSDGPSTRDGPPPTSAAASPSVQPTSVKDFIAGLKLSLEKTLIQSPPHLRVSCVWVKNLVPRCSDRLAAKSVYCNSNPEKQARRGKLSKWQPSASAPWSVSATPDATIATQFHETFQESLCHLPSARQCGRSSPWRVLVGGERRRRRLEQGFAQRCKLFDRTSNFLVSYNSVRSTP
jgi:hypothetical protein